MPTQWYLPHCLDVYSDSLMDLMDLMVEVSDEHYLVTDVLDKKLLFKQLKTFKT